MMCIIFVSLQSNSLMEVGNRNHSAGKISMSTDGIDELSDCKWNSLDTLYNKCHPEECNLKYKRYNLDC